MNETDDSITTQRERKLKKIEIFWTGGYDSTFRICQLSRKKVIIQPYYLSDKRKSETNELNAIKTVTNKLRNNKDTKAIIRDIIYVSMDERLSDKKVTDAFHNLLKQDFMGSQYEWLGIFALNHKGIEMSIHKDDKAIELISKHAKLKKIQDELGNYYVIDKDKSSKDCVTLFGNLHFPLAHYTKLQMKEEYEKMNLSDIIDDTWFCFTPIDGKPCGCCNPCKYTIEEGMSYRFSKDALKRYKRRKSILFRAFGKGKRIIKRIIH